MGHGLRILRNSAVRTSTITATAVQLVAVVTHTAEHARNVLALSEHADVLEVTLVNVWRGGSGS